MTQRDVCRRDAAAQTALRVLTLLLTTAPPSADPRRGLIACDVGGGPRWTRTTFLRGKSPRALCFKSGKPQAKAGVVSGLKGGSEDCTSQTASPANLCEQLRTIDAVKGMLELRRSVTD